MANLKEIRGRIKSIKSTQQTTRAMKLVSAAKLRRAQDSTLQFRPYALKFKELLSNLMQGQGEDDTVSSPYVDDRAVENVLYVLITSNRGLAGAFNAAIFREMTEHIQEHHPELLEQGNVHFLPIGKKGFEAIQRMAWPIVEDKNHDVFADLNFQTVKEVAQTAMERFHDGLYDKVYIAFNEFKNVVTQVRRVEQFLPVEVAGEDTEENQAGAMEYIFEPDADSIISNLLPSVLLNQFYRAVLESHASEHAARMVAMENATENAQDLLDDLRLKYNKARQAAITKEILEIVSGADALEGAG